MAQYPCDHHKERYSGAQQTAYPAIVLGGVQLREKQRLCPVCFTVVLDWCREYLADAAVDDVRTDGCPICSADDAPCAIFVTLYARGQERQDWYGRCCCACAETTAAMALFGAQPLPSTFLAQK